MRTFKSYKDIYQHHHGDINVQNLLNGRGCLKRRDWDFIKLTPELKSQLCDDIVKIMRGNHLTRAKVKAHLMTVNPMIQHRFLQRLFLVKAKRNDMPYMEFYGEFPKGKALEKIRRDLQK